MAELTRDDFVRVCVRDGMSERDAKSIMRNASTVQRLAIDQCNANISEEDARRGRRAEKRIRMVCDCYSGFVPDFSGDPRGHVVSITVPSGEYNYLGGSMAVPHSYNGGGNA